MLVRNPPPSVGRPRLRRDRPGDPAAGRAIVVALVVAAAGLLLVQQLERRGSRPGGTEVEVVGEGLGSPGLHRLEEPTVAAALRAAGGPETTDTRRLARGDRVVWSGEAARVEPALRPLVYNLPLDANSAPPAAWEALPGIGPSLAAAIVEHRARYGPFGRFEDLGQVRGIGPGALALLEPFVVVEPVGPLAPPGPLDLNRASQGELESLPGIGPTLAARILADREANGPFRSVQDLDRVVGVGPGLLRRLEGRVEVR